METLKIAICEDLSQERELLLDILNKSQYPCQVDVFENGEDFLDKFTPYKYDLILMDIFMKNITGIEIIKQIRETDKDVTVAFVTSSLDFTLESYRLDAVKYIEKPATKKAVEETLKLANLKRSEIKSLIIRTKSMANSYPLKRIICLEQKGRYALIHFTGNETISLSIKISDLEDQLENNNFVRCHKSYIVNLDFIESINQDLLIFKMIEGENVHISRSLFWQIKKSFENYLFEKTRGRGND
ncbi:MAG: LytTR family DNA-binding domain-containing protein [Clostridia bacterium]